LCPAKSIRDFIQLLARLSTGKVRRLWFSRRYCFDSMFGGKFSHAYARFGSNTSRDQATVCGMDIRSGKQQFIQDKAAIGHL
jgi:uncharacterized protein (DUF924 family)